MWIGFIIIAILLLITLLTPGTREMIPPMYSVIGALACIGLGLALENN